MPPKIKTYTRTQAQWQHVMKEPAPGVNHKEKLAKMIKITIAFGQSLSLYLSFCSKLFLQYTYSMSLNSTAAVGCSMKMGSFVLQLDTWESASNCWKFKHSDRQDAPLTHQDKDKGIPFSALLSHHQSFKARGVSVVQPLSFLCISSLISSSTVIKDKLLGVCPHIHNIPSSSL